MSEKTVKLNNIRVNKKEIHKSKQPIDLYLLNVDQTAVYDKFIGYKGEIVKPLCSILSQMTEYKK